MKLQFPWKRMVLNSTLILSLGYCVGGCQSSSSNPSTPSSAWSSRVGNYTYAQATADLGTPTESHKLSGGGTTAEWLTRRNTINPAPPSAAPQIRAGGIDQPAGPNSNTYKNEYLRLNFDEGGKLTKWERVYR